MPRNNFERAYFFYYLNKLTFAGSVQKGVTGLIDNHNLSREGYGRVDAKVVENAKKEYEYKTKGYCGLNQNRAIPQTTFHEKDFEEIKSNYSGILNNFALGTIKEKQTEQSKATYKEENAQIKGINPKTTRPYTNNDCGLLSPLDKKAIKRLRYVNLTAYPFDKVYKLFHRAFHEKKGLGEECFCYFDPPYLGTEGYYGTDFQKEHETLVDLLMKSPFHCLLSIGGNGCEEMYVEPLINEGWISNEEAVKYSTSANHQHDRKEYLLMNYEISDLPKMVYSSEQGNLEGWL